MAKLRISMYFGLLLSGLPLLCGLGTEAQAESTLTLGFEGLSNNSVADTEIGEAQLFVDVTDAGVSADQVKFVFRNIGPEASFIDGVYFDDGALFEIAAIEDSGDGVAFSQGASPPDLPGGNSADPPFETTAGFLADADGGGNGVDPGEWVAVIFDLQSGKGFQDVVDALVNAEQNPDLPSLRIGIKVQGFEGGGSDTFINTPPDGTTTIIPEPSTFALAGLGIVGLLGYGWRRRRSRTPRRKRPGSRERPV